MRTRLAVLFLLSLVLFIAGNLAAQENTDLLPVSDLATPDQLQAGYDRQQITPMGDKKFQFEILVPKDWDSQPFEVSKADVDEAEAGKSLLRMAVFTPKSQSEQAVIETHFMRVPVGVELEIWMNKILELMDGEVLARQRGEYNERKVEDALLKKNSENGTVFMRFTASRHGDYILTVMSATPERDYDKFKRIFGLAAVTFDPTGISPAQNSPK